MLMVGGGTYIPYVRKHVEELMGIAVNTSIRSDQRDRHQCGFAGIESRRGYRERHLK